MRGDSLRVSLRPTRTYRVGVGQTLRRYVFCGTFCNRSARKPAGAKDRRDENRRGPRTRGSPGPPGSRVLPGVMLYGARTFLPRGSPGSGNLACPLSRSRTKIRIRDRIVKPARARPAFTPRPAPPPLPPPPLPPPPLPRTPPPLLPPPHRAPRPDRPPLPRNRAPASSWGRSGSTGRCARR